MGHQAVMQAPEAMASPQPLSNVKTSDGFFFLLPLASETCGSKHMQRTATAPRRKKAVQIETLIAAISILLSSMVVICHHSAAQKFAAGFAGSGRRLAAGQPNYAVDDDQLLSEVLDACVELQEEINYKVPDRPLPGRGEAVSEAYASILKMQEELDSIKPLSEDISVIDVLQDKTSQNGQKESLYSWDGELPNEVPETAQETFQATDDWGGSNDLLQVFSDAIEETISQHAKDEALLSWDADALEMPPEVPDTAQAKAQPAHGSGCLADPLQVSSAVSPLGAAAHSPLEQWVSSRRTGEKRSIIDLEGDSEARSRKKTSSPANILKPESASSELTLNGGNLSPTPMKTGQESLGQTIAPSSPLPASSPAGSSPSGYLALSASDVSSEALQANSHGVHESFRAPRDKELVPSSLQASEDSTASFMVPSLVPPMPLTTHLYYRLPHLDREKVRRRFVIARAFSSNVSRSGYPELREIRRLLAQPAITPIEADVLIVATERLVNFMLHYHRTFMHRRRPGEAAITLARRYLLFEGVFCVIQVVGPAMIAPSWWSRFCALIPKDPAPPPKGEGFKTIKLYDLVTRLSSAIDMLKNGIRPSEQMTVRLKRALFTTYASSLNLEDENKLEQYSTDCASFWAWSKPIDLSDAAASPEVRVAGKPPSSQELYAGKPEPASLQILEIVAPNFQRAPITLLRHDQNLFGFCRIMHEGTGSLMEIVDDVFALTEDRVSRASKNMEKNRGRRLFRTQALEAL
ncbi:hypothetical protein Efla_002546 [Eimeria flavescens]